MGTDAFQKFSTKYGLDSEIVASFCESFATHVDPVVPSAYIEIPPFPVRRKEHAKVSTVVNKSYIRTPKPDEQIKVEPSIAMVKDLLEEDMDGHVIYFCEETARLAKPDKRDTHRHVVGMPVISVKIGDHFCHGLCDMGASVSAIRYTLYEEIMKDITPSKMEEIDVTIKLANRDSISP